MYNKFEFSERVFLDLRKLALAGLAFVFAVAAPQALLIGQTALTIDGSESATNNQLEADKTWQLKNEAQALEAIEIWIDESPSLQEDALKNAVLAFNEFLPDETESPSSYAADRLDRVVAALSRVRPDIAKIAVQLSQQRSSVIPPNFSHILDNQDEHPFVQNHVRLFFGRWLSQNQFYDEALEQLNSLDVDSVMSPESVLFYRALAEHQLLQKSECNSTIETLLQHEADLPIRFSVIAKVMRTDLAPVTEGSLDEISRMMKDIYRRTQFQRSGTLVLKQEADVIDKLDDLIEELEQQQQQQQQQSQSSQSATRPMEESSEAGGKGDGKVTLKDLADGGQWGDMAPAERSAALAEMVKDMPPHYRSAIEEYFRRLAREGSK